MAADFMAHVTSGDGVMTKEEFFTFQNDNAGKQKEKYGHGLEYTADESAQIYDAMSGLEPSYAGIKVEDLGRLGASIQAAKAAMAGQ